MRALPFLKMQLTRDLDPLQYYLHLRYKPTRENFKNCKECPAFDYFDWVVWAPDAKKFLRFRRLFPRYVLCLAHRESLDALLKFRYLLRKSVVVIAGEDTPLSAVLPQVELLASSCKSIFYESKNVEHPKIKSFCMGFISFYLNRIDNALLIDQIRRATSDFAMKQGVLAAWGAIWKVLDETLSERRDAARFVEQCHWIEREQLEADEYIERLAQSQYLLAPAGNGIQAPKLAEAWLMRTVPIVIRNPCFEDLHRAGYPLLLLDSWSDLTLERLETHQATRVAIDWDRVCEMLTLRYFVDQVLRSE